MSGSAGITEKIRQKARELNIDLIGAIPSEWMDEFAGMEVNWDRWGTMKSPRDYLPDARSVVVVAEVAFGPTIDLAVKRRGGWNYVGYKPLELDTWEIGSYLQSLGYQAEVFASHLSTLTSCAKDASRFAPFSLANRGNTWDLRARACDEGGGEVPRYTSDCKGLVDETDGLSCAHD